MDCLTLPISCTHLLNSYIIINIIAISIQHHHHHRHYDSGCITGQYRGSITQDILLHPLLFEFVACVVFDIDLHKQLEKGTSARLLLNGPLGLLV